MLPIRIKACSESDLRMLGNLARNIQRVLPVTQADIDAAAALGKGWVVWKVVEVNDPIDNLRGGTQLVIKQNSITPGQNVRRVLIVQGPGGETVVIGPGPSPLLLPDAIANSLRYVKAFGGTEQNGTPTPDAPIDIVCNNGVLKYSKNLLDMSAENIVLGKYINNNGVISDSGPNFYNSKYIPVVAGGTYTWSTSSSISYFSVMEYGSDYAFKKRTLFSNAGTSGSITLRSDTAFVLIGSNMDSTDITLDRITAVDWQFEKGSSATAYTPYVEGGFYTDGTVETINAHGKNIFNKDDAQVGKNWNNSTMAYSIASGYIPAKKGDAFTLSISDMPKYASTTWAVLDSDYTYLGTTSNGSEITQDACAYVRLSIRCANTDTWTQSDLDNAKIQLEKGSTATEYAPYYDGGTATAEMLLKVGDYQDVQSILDGAVTRNVGVLVFDGTETMTAAGGNSYFSYTAEDKASGLIASVPLPISTHFQTAPNTGTGSIPDNGIGASSVTSNKSIWFKMSAAQDTTAFKAFLADQYAAGTPVIVIYPLATPTTESVTGQTLQVTDGDNTLEITQAGMSGLELEAEYTKVA
jgi:hypothetical protein